jgi:hypothetical protein
MSKPFAAAVLLLLAATAAAAADRVQSGQWETTMTGVGPKPTVSRYCVTAADAKLMNGDVATLRKYVEQSTAEKMKGRCAVKDVQVKGNQTIVTITCGKTAVTTTTTYHGDRYEAASTAGTALTGKRLGACP